MEALENILNKAIRLNAEKALEEVLSVKKLQEYIANQNKFQLYQRGVDGDGKSLGQYKESTKAAKSRKGQRTDHITLFDTGEYYDSKKVFFDGSEIMLTEDPIKGSKSFGEGGSNLYGRFGKSIAGWDNESIDNIRGAFKLEMLNYLRKIFNIKQEGIIYPANAIF